MDPGLVFDVLMGDLPEESHAAAMARFWDACPRFERMRGVIDEIVAHRRQAAALHEARLAEMRDRHDAEMKATWSWLEAMIAAKATTMSPDQIGEMTDESSERCRDIWRAEISETTKAMRENSEDVARCMRVLCWHAERETLTARTRCA